MREVKVHAADAEEARSDGAAALGVSPEYVEVAIIEQDEDGVTALVTVPVEPEPAAPESTLTDEPDGDDPFEDEDDLDDDDDYDGEDEKDDADDYDDDEEEEEEDDDPDSLRSVSARASRFLRTMLDLMDLDARGELVSADEEEILLNIVGEDLGIVIGARGATLNALQYLLNLMVNHGGPRRRIVLDAEGYRERRRQLLVELAQEQAKRAKSERRPVVVEGLEASERRIIHTTLQHDPEVMTYSEGEGAERRLVIRPSN